MKLKINTNREVLGITVEQHGKACPEEDDMWDIEPKVMTAIAVEDVGVINCYNDVFDEPPEDAGDEYVEEYNVELS